MNNILNKHNCLWLIILAIVVNGSGLLSPVLNSNDAYFYAVISKNILLNHDWINLTYAGTDWLDKPHLPFWLTAISFKVFGINSFAYVLPGFLFHLFGAYYTFRLAKYFYGYRTGVCAALIYVTSLHLLLSTIDVRAEAYLLGEIMPAVYYWLLYDKEGRARNLLLASVFTALALMTKGLFVVVTIFSGVAALWLYTSRYKEVFRPKWLGAYVLVFLLIIPELACLYLQFDAHPEKIMFGYKGVSGIVWFFWDSQFGRFFNSGPIVNSHGNPFFFIHTFLWAFLPWSLVFIVAMYQGIAKFKSIAINKRSQLVYLQISFWLTFIMFSATKFQLDHYTNIIMPFAAIICANYLVNGLNQNSLIKMANVQSWLSLILLVLLIVISVIIFKLSWLTFIVMVPILLILCLLGFRRNDYTIRLFYLPSLAILTIFVVLMLINGVIYPRYNTGYNIANYLRSKPPHPLYSLQVPALINSLAFHSMLPTSEVRSPPTDNYPYYLVVKKEDLGRVNHYDYTLLANYNGIALEKMVPALFNSAKFNNSLIPVDLLFVRGKK